MNFREIINLKDNRKIHRFLIFLALSLTFWIFTSLNRTGTTSLVFGVEYLNVPFGKHLLKDAPDKLFLEIEGKGLDIMIERFKNKDRFVSVDLSDQRLNDYLGSGRMIIPSQSFYNLFLPKIGSKLNVKEFSPDVVQLSFVDKFTKSVDVVIPYSLNYGMSSGLSKAPIPTPSTVRITGPKETLDLISFVNTDTLTMESSSGKFKGTLQLFNSIPDQFDMEISEVSYALVLEEYTEKTFELPVYEEHSQQQNRKVMIIPGKVQVKLLVPISKFDQLNENDIKCFVSINDKSDVILKAKVHVKCDLSIASHIRTVPERVYCMFKDHD